MRRVNAFCYNKIQFVTQLFFIRVNTFQIKGGAIKKVARNPPSLQRTKC